MQMNLRIYGMPGHLIRRLQQHSNHAFYLHAKSAGIDLTSVQFAALDAIRDNPGIDQAGVSALIAYDRPTIGGVIERLEAKGLVARQVSSKDRRAREISLTQKGEAVYGEFLPVVRDLQQDILRGLTDDEQGTFMRLARKVLESSAGSQGEAEA